MFRKIVSVLDLRREQIHQRHPARKAPMEQTGRYFVRFFVQAPPPNVQAPPPNRMALEMGDRCDLATVDGNRSVEDGGQRMAASPMNAEIRTMHSKTPELLHGLLLAMVALMATRATAAPRPDTDFDGVADAFDVCPSVCAAGQDFNHDGCADTACGLYEYLDDHFTRWVFASVDPTLIVPIPHPILEEDERLPYLLSLASAACDEETSGTADGAVSALQELIAAVTQEELPLIDETLTLSVVSQASVSMSYLMDLSDPEYIAFPSQCPAVPIDETCDDTSIVWTSDDGDEPCRGSWEVQAYDWCADEACACIDEDCTSRWQQEGAELTLRVTQGYERTDNSDDCLPAMGCDDGCNIQTGSPTLAEAEVLATGYCRDAAWDDARSNYYYADVVAVDVDVAYAGTTGTIGTTCYSVFYYEFICNYTLLGECPCLERGVCRAEGCGVKEPVFSDFNSTSNLTNALLERSGLYDPGNSALGGPGADAGICTTDEQNLTLTSDADVQAKFDKLQNRRLGALSLPSGRIGADLKAQLLRYQSYLGIEKWDQLTSTQRDVFLALSLNPTWCEVSNSELESVNTACEHDAASLWGAWELARCLLVRDQINGEPTNDQRHTLFDSSTGCMDLKSFAAAQPEDDCGDAYRESVDAMISEVIGTGDNAGSGGWAGLIGITQDGESDLDEMENGTSTDVEHNSLWITLRLIHAWYLRERQVLDKEQALAALSQRLADFWDTIQAAAGGDPFVDEDTTGLWFNDQEYTGEYVEDGIGLYADASRYAERAVLRTLFSNPAPMSGHPVLMLTGDALMPLVDRLDASVPFVDLACRFKSCDGEELFEIIGIFEVLGSIIDSDLLSSSLARSGSEIRDSYFSVFDDMLGSHTVLQEAFESVHESVLLEDLLSSEVSVSAIGLKAAVDAARSRARTFRSTGMFSGDHAYHLHAGVGEDSRALLESDFETAINGLGKAIADYKTNRIGYVHNLIAEIDSHENMTEVFNEIEDTWSQLTDTFTDIEALRKRLRQDETRYANFAAEFDRIARLAFSDDFAKIDGETFTVAAGQAKYEPGNPSYDPAFGAVHRNLAASINGDEETWEREGAAGDLITFHVSESWSPLCALSYAPLPSFVEVRPDLGTLTGPEGFELAKTGNWSSEVTSSNNDQTTESSCSATSLEVSVHAETGVSYMGIGASVDSSMSYAETWEDCHSIIESTTNSVTTGNGYATSFSSGMKVRQTPYYKQGAAVGALLLVAVDPESGKLVDLWTVGRQSAILLEQDAILYLTVNDLSSGAEQVEDSACADGELTVNVAQLRPANSAATSTVLIEAMKEVLKDVRTKAEEVYADAPILPSELAGVRDEAWQALRTKVVEEGGGDWDAYPEIYKGFFGVWLDMETSRLERRSRLIELSRRARQLKLKLDTLDTDLRLTGVTARNLRLMSRWIARDLSGEKLRSALDSAFEMAEEEVYPVIRMRYPNTFAGAVGAWSQTLDELMDTDFTLPAVDKAADAHEMLEGLLDDHLANAQRRENTNVEKVVIAFPRRTDSCDPAYATCASLFRPVDATRAAQAWRPLDDPSDDPETQRFGVFTVVPNDLYVNLEEPATLGCFQYIPVIRSMAVVVEADANFDESVINDGSRAVQASVYPNLVFTQANGPLTYAMQNGDWRFPSPDLLFTNNEEEVLLTFNDYLSRVYNQPNGEYRKASGLSPFTTYSLEMLSAVTGEPYDWPFMDYARAFYLVFEVEVQEKGTSLDWLAPYCSPQDQ